MTELRQLLVEVGDGGQVGPSSYDTAQLLRYAPPQQDLEGAYGWLLTQQQGDGGWGEPGHPLYRDVPTAAAILALHARDHGARHRSAIAAGIEFLNGQDALWQAPLAEDIPIGIELILPRLLVEANAVGLALPAKQYDALVQLGEKKLALLRQATLPVGSPPLHSWEAWGGNPSVAMLDRGGSVGISPSATAAWLYAARHAGIDAALIANAEHYLEQASAGTGVEIAGVVPNVWPIDVFEPSWILHTLALGDVLQHTELAAEVMRIVTSLRGAIDEKGLGAAVNFAPDGDDTAVVMSVLAMTGHVLPYNPLHHFALGNLFLTYPGERNPALSTTIHAVHALRLIGESIEAGEAYLEQSRDDDGVWSGEKWHASWLYPTSQAIAALGHGRPAWSDERALAGVLAQQHACGGWGAGDMPTFEETAYAVLSLHMLSSPHNPARVIADAMGKAYQWMLGAYVPYARPIRALWIGKELYCPRRVVRVVELVGLLVASRWSL